MPFTFRLDLSRQLTQLRSLKEQVLGLVRQALPEAAGVAVEESGYTEGSGDTRGGGITVEEVLSDVRDTGSGVELDVAQVYDWVLGTGRVNGHCQDCLDRAAASPYTDATLPGEPGDGSTICGDACDCEVVPRDLRLDEGVFGDAVAETVNGGIQL